MVGDVVGGGGVGADDIDRQHVQVLDPALAFLCHFGHVATGAVFGEQRTALGGQRFIDRAQQLFRPGWRFEALQCFFNQMQVAHPHAGRVAVVAHERLAVVVEEIQRGPHTQGFADVACHGLLRRAIPLHPVEGPHVPQLRIVHRCVGHPVVGGGNRIAKTGVGNATERVGAARAFLGRVEPSVGIVPGDFEEGVEGLFEVLAQLLVLSVVILAQDIAGETLEFPGVVVSRCQTSDQCLSETATT
ncbi:hypothetical protein D3C73_890310 [compost metagenome]